MMGVFAQLLSQEGLLDRITVDCAGTHPGKTPRKPDRRIERLAAQRGIDLSGIVSKPVDSESVKKFDLILVMNEDNFWHLKSLCPEESSSPRVQLLMEYSGQLGQREIPDPLMGEISFEEALDILEKVAGKLLEELKSKLTLDDMGNITLKW